MPHRGSLLLILGVAACASSTPKSPYETARSHGYVGTEELHEVVQSVQQLEPGLFQIGFDRSARFYRVSSRLSPDADRLVESARASVANRQPVYATILVHESAPKTKTPEAFRAVSASFPWILVRLGAERDPSIAR